MTECIVCKIANREIPTDFVAESLHAVAFRDRSPMQAVHVLVVPKEHFTDVADLASKNEEILIDLMKLGTLVASQQSTGSFRFQFNTGSEAGQTVFHAHGHITSTTPKN